MARVVCRILNAGRVIDGIAFAEPVDGAMLSEEIGDEAAKRLLTIPGFEKPREEAAPEAPPAERKADGKRTRNRAQAD